MGLFLLGPANFIVPLIGWLAGFAVVRRSPHWSDDEKGRGLDVALRVQLAVVLGAILVFLGAHFGGLPMWMEGFSVVVFLASYVVVPLVSAVYMAWQLRDRVSRERPFWAAVLTIVVVVPCGVAVAPVRAHAFAELYPNTSRCAALYGTQEYGGPLGGVAHINVGYCSDGKRVRVSWGPDCPTRGVGALVVDVTTCKARPNPDGGLTIDLATKGRALTSTFFAQTRGTGWDIQPDGSLVDPDGP